jgi:hypothetical protein
LKYHYRLSDCWNEDGSVSVIVERFELLRETKEGYWVLSEYACSDESRKRWTPKLGPRYCHSTMKDAILYYSLRKQWEQKHIKHRLMKNKTVLLNLENLTPSVLEEEQRQTFSVDRF